jgi:hypothetical protein
MYGHRPVKDNLSKKRAASTFSPSRWPLIRPLSDDWKGLIMVAFYTGARQNDFANLSGAMSTAGKVKKIAFDVAKTDDN